MEEYLEFAKSLADESAVIAMKYFGFDTVKTLKLDNSPVTEADKLINDLVIKRVNEKFPAHSILGEENSDMKKDSEYVWVCDPIDGTIPFSAGLPTFTFSLALVEQKTGQPVLGVVNDPVLKNMYWAYKGSGAYRNGIKIFVTKDTSLKTTYMSSDGSGRHSGFSYTELFKILNDKQAKVMKLLSVVYSGIQVPNGKFTGTVFFGQYAHDVAALKIITEEAGGKATDLNGNERRYDQEGLGIVISNGILHEEILECVRMSKV